MADLHRSDLEGCPTRELLRQALALSHVASEWENRNLIVAVLEARGDDETFDAVKKWSESSNATERKLAADLLNQFGERAFDDNGEPYFLSADRVVPLLKKLIDDPDSGVIASAVSGLGWNGAYDCILARSALCEHDSSSVRYAVDAGLNGAESKAAIDNLIALAGDADDNVRDRANWVLGVVSCLDTAEIREALVRNLTDHQIDTRCEAMVGLARRKDVRAIPPIKRELAAESVCYAAIEAAGHMASPQFVKSLEALRSGLGENRELINRALNRCKEISDPDDDEPWVEEGEIVVPAWATLENG